MSELMKLREDHAALARIFRDLGAMIAEADPPPQLDLFNLRRELVSTLLAHLKLEDWSLYPRLIDSGDSELSAIATRFKEEMGGLAPAFLAYCDKWTASTIPTDWPAYCTDARTILDALHERLTRENRELLPLLERVDRAA